MVSGHKTFQIRTVFHHHCAVGAETTGRNNHAFRLNGQGFLLFGQQTYTAHFALLKQNVIYGGIQHHIDTAFVHVAHRCR